MAAMIYDQRRLIRPAADRLRAASGPEVPLSAEERLRVAQVIFGERMLGDEVLHDIVSGSLGLAGAGQLDTTICRLEPWRLPTATGWRMGCLASWLGAATDRAGEGVALPLQQAIIQLLVVTRRAVPDSMLYRDYGDCPMFVRPTRRLADAGGKTCIAAGWLVVASRQFLQETAGNPAYAAPADCARVQLEPAGLWSLSHCQEVAAA